MAQSLIRQNDHNKRWDYQPRDWLFARTGVNSSKQTHFTVNTEPKDRIEKKNKVIDTTVKKKNNLLFLSIHEELQHLSRTSNKYSTYKQIARWSQPSIWRGWIKSPVLSWPFRCRCQVPPPSFRCLHHSSTVTKLHTN